MDKQPLTLRERQLEYLRILKELDRFCAENNIRYYMGCGTLIGAVRHKGFIPWDDDLDVFVPKPDFERLCHEYKSNEFSLHTIYNDKSHPYTFGRLCSNDVFSVFRKQKLYNFGIDIYIIYGAPIGLQEQMKHIDNVWVYLKRKNALVRLRNGLVKRHLWLSRSLDFKWLNRVLHRAEQEFELFDFEMSDYIWPYGGGRLIMKKENYGTPIRLQFEDGTFSAPEYYHEVLSLGYGDYMQLPPEKDRRPYHTGIVYYREKVL